MKKILSLLIAFVLAFSVIAVACVDENAEDISSASDNQSNPSEGASSDISDDNTSDTSDDTSDVVEDVDPYPEDETGWNYHTLVSKGKSYTSSAPASETYSDLYGQQLTDGEKTGDVGSHYVDTRMVGYTGNITFEIDLGKYSRNVSEIVARSLVMYQDGVTVASNAKFSGSVDGKEYVNLGTVFFAEPGNQTVSEARLVLEETVDYRYIRVLISRGNGHFFFTDEIEVYANVPPMESEDKSVLAYESENIDRHSWQNLSKGNAANPVDTEVVSRGNGYKFEYCTFDERALDNESGTKLTDGGRTNQYFSNPVWVGVIPSEERDAEITVSLGGKQFSNIYAFKVYTYGNGVDVDFPAYIDVYATASTAYTYIGRMYGPEQGNNFTYTLILPEYITAKNVKFAIPAGSGSVWIEEIEVITGYDEEQYDLYYPKLDLPEVTEDVYWDSSESDYNTVQNLLLGRTQQVNPLFYADIDERGDKTHVESTASFPYLTDGKRASDLYCYGTEWFFTRGNAGIEFIYDLEKLSAVSSVTVGYLEQNDWGIQRPKFAAVLLSDDGENWYKVGDYIRGDAQINAGATALELNFNFDKTYAARFVRVRLEGGVMFFDEIKAMGSKNAEDATRLSESGLIASPLYTNEESEQFATPENTPIKANDIPIIYGNKTEPENLLPMVAYIDEEGNIVDTFMDGFLYCPTGVLPSGKLPHLDNYKEDWEYMYDICFNGRAGFDALESTVQTVKDQLGLDDHKVQVYITILTVCDTVTDFGDVDGDGIGEDLSTPEGRKTVIDWYIDMCMEEFDSRDYKNLELGGFYWVSESVSWEKDDSAIIEEVAEYVHAKGTYFLWIPYYTANRYYTGYELGFDIVSMQPNVAFTPDAPYWRFDAAMNFTKLRKMAIEIEHSYQAFGDPEFARSYLLYLYNGVVSGYDKAVNIYYDDIDNIAVMGKSTSALCRLQYDATYHYTKGTLKITPDKKEDYKLSTATDTVISGYLNEADEIAMFTLLTAPENGYVAFSKDGSFRYFPDKGFTGTDTFTYTYNNLLGESEACVVEITVG